MGSTKTNTYMLLNSFGMRLFFLTIPKPLKQYTLFKKDDPLRSPKRRLYEPEAHTYVLTIKTPQPLTYL